MVLPDDLIPLASMAAEAFQYPDHPEWSMQADEQRSLVESLERMRRVWPLVRVGQVVSPALRDVARGFVFEDNGSIGGSTLAQREGTTSTWIISAVAVLPRFRHRGIGRELVLETLEMIRARGGTAARLSVIDGNTPAQSLYRSLGFADYGSSTVYTLQPADHPESPVVPSRYDEARLAQFDWRTRYELDRRIVPETQQRFEPVTVCRYRVPLLMRAFTPLMTWAMGTRSRDVVIRRRADAQPVARAGWTASTRGEGVNRIRVRLDPACPDLAPILVGRLLHAVLERSPTLRIEAHNPSWSPAIARALEQAGFVPRETYLEMGIRLQARSIQAAS